MARYDRARDATQASFIEAAGVNLHTYVAPGTAHTILRIKDLYKLEVEGVRLIDWITDFVNGVDVADVHCQDCGP